MYFKNPGERTAVNQQYLNSIGGDKLMRVDLLPEGSGKEPVITAGRTFSLFSEGKKTGTTTMTSDVLRKERDKRTQVISYLTAKDAADMGLDKQIRSYDINSFPVASCNINYRTLPRMNTMRKPNHVSEVTVLNSDGRRYIYGTPVYNVEQVDVNMSTATGDQQTGLVGYDPTKDNTKDNNRGKEAFFKEEIMSPYAHAFLLSGILSTDYTDITGDGITEDDPGDAVKFNYSRVYDELNPFKWRAPHEQDKAFYDEGLKTDNRDERGSYSYGTKEVWYLNSIESKTMIATFVLDDSVRKDAHGVLSPNGGRSTAQKLYRLKQINLYSKADYLKNGPANAKPIKSVHFGYSYRLCKGTPDSEADTGKLTLERIWFTYNKNKKGQRNPYIFSYNTKNPNHDSKMNDRWGNYKNPVNNPGTTGGPMTNADYPYALQKGVKNWTKDSADYYAAAWTLSDIKLPSGGKIKVSYEADDYAYVQNRRAMQLFSLAGFADTSTSTPVNNLYLPGKSAKDYSYAFINVTEAVANKEDIKRKYLEGVDRLFFKVQVRVPEDIWGKGYETVPCYAAIEDYDLKGDPSNKMIWVKLKPLKPGESPIATTVLQFLRMNLPSKAYPYSEPGDEVSFRSFVGTLASVITNFNDAFEGYSRRARHDNYCNEVLLEKSFVRLNNPVYRKLGGGHRVKKIEVYDHFKAMTKDSLLESKYGQEYDYNTTVDIDGVATTISSGVATYEPMIGNEENPFRVPIEFEEQISTWAPVNYMFAEEPFAETFFPSPSVGYSKVRVQSIHKDKKSAIGAEETEYYTAKDFPTLVEWTPLDPETKRRFKPDLLNTAKINARNFITLSQGFKVELNDMHGQVKSQASYSQNNLKDPISYTKNYFRLEKDDAGKPRLSNTVQLVDSANGKIRTGIIGKEVELMVDVREQTSYTVGGSIQSNLDFMHVPPPIFSVSVIPLPNFETNRYRSIAVLKVVNRYGILDSMIKMDKGSVVSTRNKLYDSETGGVLLSENNNEFDDPTYNFSYPAHWAYTGMGPAYKNLGTVLKDMNFRRGILFRGVTKIATERYFESGDEIWVRGNYIRNSAVNDYCNPLYYSFDPGPGTKIWAVEASKGKEGHKGIYFIDKDGRPFSGDNLELTIIRSGRRNMPAASIGSVISMKNPVKTVSGALRLVLDSSISVITAGSIVMKDFWRVDSTNYRKDTVMTGSRLTDSGSVQMLGIGQAYTIRRMTKRPNTRTYHDQLPGRFTAWSKDNGPGSDDEETKSWLRFDIESIRNRLKKGAVIKSATLKLFARNTEPHNNFRGDNSCYIERLTGPWPGSAIPANGPSRANLLVQYFNGTTLGAVETSTRATISATPFNQTSTRSVLDPPLDVKAIVQGMVDDYYDKGIPPAIRIAMVNNGGLYDKWSSMAYNAAELSDCGKLGCTPYIDIEFYEPCYNGVKSASGYCYDVPIDSFICKPNINDTAVNPYRWGIYGNWRIEKDFVYYNRRKESDPMALTNIRTDGEIKSFMPFWFFTDSVLDASTDSSRWVWNSREVVFNMKGAELENADPLGRHNAAQYGYNKTLPVAVGQNTKSREIAFDGFEDYNFKTDTCKKCLDERFIELASGGTLVDTISHTGVYSLRLNGNQTLTKTIPIVTKQQDSLPPTMSLRLDSTAIIRTAVTGAGTGLTTRFMAVGGNSCTGNQFVPIGITPNLNQPPTKRAIGIGNCQWTTSFSLKWNGFIQPLFTGMYKFRVRVDNRMTIAITRNGIPKTISTPVIANDKYPDSKYDEFYYTDTIYLHAGNMYKIDMLFSQGNGLYSYILEWESDGAQKQERTVVPQSQFYPETTDTAAMRALTVHNDTTWCVSFANARPDKITNPRFSPLQGKKVVVSAWVKQQGLCINGNYDYVQLELEFNNAGQNYFLLKPKGNIIEGWQRIEDTLTIPANATSLSFRMKSTSSSVVYFDDIRIHPFNANMKSFVYNPVNLRLMAELDENNYATFYEYDDEGTLTRLKKETERGIKTIKETRSALLKE